MIRVKKQENTTLFYECECGSKGICTFKPKDGEALIVLHIECPLCGSIERFVISQYYADDYNPLINIQKSELSWVPFVTEELITE